MPDRMLLQGGHVLTVDPDLGDHGGLTADLSGPRALIEASKQYLVDALARCRAESP